MSRVDRVDTGYSREPGGGGVSGAGHWSEVPPPWPLLGLLHMWPSACGGGGGQFRFRSNRITDCGSRGAGSPAGTAAPPPPRPQLRTSPISDVPLLTNYDLLRLQWQCTARDQTMPSIDSFHRLMIWSKVWLFDFSNPCTASTCPRPLCGPLPLAEVWTGTGNRTAAVSGEVRRWRYLSRAVMMSRDWPQIVTSRCTRMLSPSRYISSDLLPPFPDFLELRSQSFHLGELHSSNPNHMSYNVWHTLY